MRPPPKGKVGGRKKEGQAVRRSRSFRLPILGESTANDVSTYMDLPCPRTLYFLDFGPLAKRNSFFFSLFFSATHSTGWRPSAGRLFSLDSRQFLPKMLLGRPLEHLPVRATFPSAPACPRYFSYLAAPLFLQVNFLPSDVAPFFSQMEHLFLHKCHLSSTPFFFKFLHLSFFSPSPC